MKKNKILIILLSLVLCGCSAQYNIKISNNKVSDKAIIFANKEQVKEKAKFDYYYNYKLNKKYRVQTNNDKLILFNKKIDFESIASNDLYRFCFEIIEATETDDFYSLGTSEGFRCMNYEEQKDLDEITVVLNTFNKVTEHNADETKFGKYIWYFDKYNSKDKKIYFTVKKNDYLWYYRYRGLILGLSGVLVLVILVSIIIKIFKNKSNKENKI